MGIFTYLKIGAIVVLLGVCGFYVWNYHHMQAKIAAQQMEIDNLKTVQGVLEKKTATIEAFMAKKTAVKRKVANVERKIDEEVATGDPARVIQLFAPYRGVQQGSQVHPAAPGRKGGAQPHP